MDLIPDGGRDQNYIPEVRKKYLTRQLNRKNYRKNVVAGVSTLLKLIMCLVKENRKYEFKDNAFKELEKLEEQYQLKMTGKKKKKAA